MGKSALAIKLAMAFDGEIVSADSRQVYRHLDIGTAKPSPAERAIVSHHLIDVVNPDEEFTLAHYQESAPRAIADIHRRRKQPFLVGGTGLYVRAVVEGLRLPQVAPNHELRGSLQDRAERDGAESLHRELAQVDPEAAARIDPRNLRRVIRALEVWHETGVPFSELGQADPPPYHTLTIGLTTSRADLYRRIDDRVDQQMAAGLVNEVERLRNIGYGWELPAMSALGYKQIGEHLRGEVDLPTAIHRIKMGIHRFARHQYAWFRPTDPRIHWFDVREEFEASAKKLMAEWLASIHRLM